jgi:hypothetical protein
LLHKQLEQEERDLAEKSAVANAVLAKVTDESAKVEKEQEFVDKEKANVLLLNEDVARHAAACARFVLLSSCCVGVKVSPFPRLFYIHKHVYTHHLLLPLFLFSYSSYFLSLPTSDLERAEPALVAAKEALHTLNKPNLTELKSFATPTEEVQNVMKVVMLLLSPPGKIARDLSWRAAKVTIGGVDKFLEQLQQFDKDNIPDAVLERVRPIVMHRNFTREFIIQKSAAAAGICEWARNVVIYHEIYREIEPKRLALSQVCVCVCVCVCVLVSGARGQ